MNEIIRQKTEMGSFVEHALVESYSKIFIVNVNTGEFDVFKNDGLYDDADFCNAPDIYAYIEKLISDKIYPEYVTACRRFTNPEYVRKSVFSGVKRIVQSYRRRTPKGDRWVTFAIIAGASCAPENPLVLFTWREADSDSITLLDTLPTISSLYDKLIRINLTNNTYEPVIVDDDDQDRLVGGVINMHEWWAEYSNSGNISSEDMSAFSALTKSGSLQKRFAEDHTPISFRYRRKVGVGDEFRWVQLEIAPSVEYSEDNQIMLLSLKDVHEEYTAQMRSRQALIDNMNRDALTGLFNRLKFNEDIESLEKSTGSLFTCLYIDLNGLHELNNKLGHRKGDEMLCCVASTLKKHYPNDNVYRIGGDEFVVLSTKLEKDEILALVKNVRRDLSAYHYEISIGAASGACKDGVNHIINSAELAMRGDKAEYYKSHGDRRKNRAVNEEVERIMTERHDSEHFLEVIAKEFSGVYFVDLKLDTVRHIYIPEHFSELLKETDDCFSAALKLYAERYVVPEDRSKFDNIVDFNVLGERLSEDNAVQFSYQRSSDGKNMNLRIVELDKRDSDKPETIWIFS